MKLTTPLSSCLLFAMGSLAFACTQNQVLGDKADARVSTDVAGSGGFSGTGGRGSGGGGVSGTGGNGTGGVPGSGGAATGGVSGSGGASASGGRGTAGGSGSSGGNSGTGGRGTGGSGSGGVTPDGGVGCAVDGGFWCVSGITSSGGGVSCGDALSAATCTNGVWACPGTLMPTTQCDCLGQPPVGCSNCAPSGWLCTDGGADARTDASVCDFGCYPIAQMTACATGKVTWQCTGASPDVSLLINGGCTDTGTDLIRYCCPSTLFSQCPARP